MARSGITRVEVDPQDPALAHPQKPIGPVYTPEQAQALARAHRWCMAMDGAFMRRVVASPEPLRVFVGLQVNGLVIATDVDAAYLNWGQAGQRALRQVTAQELSEQVFAPGSMQPKVQAACRFVQATGKRCWIGALGEMEAMLQGDAGTEICSAL